MENTDIISISDAYVDDIEQIQDVIYRSSKDVYLKLGCSSDFIQEKFKDRCSDTNLQNQRKIIQSLSQNEKFIVARLNGVIVGICYGEKQNTQNVLQALYVLPEYQNKGVAKQLWDSISQWIADKDIYLRVLEGNVPAISFYKKMGFIETGNRFENTGMYLSNGAAVFDIEMRCVKLTSI